jgi:carbon-monoxide dehydrogenase small subunit
MRRIDILLNGSRKELEVEDDAILLDVLREGLGLTGTKEACGIGVCGACAVLVDGAPMSACLLLAVLIDGRAIRTIEGISEADGSLSVLQDSFIRNGGFQCGICTSGQIVTATALLEQVESPAAETIREWMMGNLCRCTGYEGIMNAVLDAAGGARP